MSLDIKYLSTKLIEELEVAMSYFNNATEDEEIDKAIKRLNRAEANLNMPRKMRNAEYGQNQY